MQCTQGCLACYHVSNWSDSKTKNRAPKCSETQISVRLVGLALSYTLQLSGLLQWAVRQTAEAENDMTSVERVLQYTHLPQEPARLSDGATPPPKCVGPPPDSRLHLTADMTTSSDQTANHLRAARSLLLLSARET